MLNPSSRPRTELATSFPVPNPLTSSLPLRGTHHRRAHSEVHFRTPEELDPVSDSLLDEFGSEDDLFCSYMDIEQLGSRPRISGQSFPKTEIDAQVERPRHRHSNSVDGALMLESIEAKKAIAPDKLAELWIVEPKRAKRLLSLFTSIREFIICIWILVFFF